MYLEILEKLKALISYTLLADLPVKVLHVSLFFPSFSCFGESLKSSFAFLLRFPGTNSRGRSCGRPRSAMSA